MANVSLSDRIAEEMEQRANLHVAVQESGDAIVLSGMVDSVEAHDVAIDIAARLAPGRRIEDDIEVTSELVTVDSTDEMGSTGSTAESIAEIGDPNRDLVADMTDQPLNTNVIDVVEDAEEPYFPPTDPVVGVDDRGDLEVLGGLTPTSTTSTDVEPSSMDDMPGDEAIAEAVRRELREDASTTDLRLHVAVRRGVVRLRGLVPDRQDAENAEAVAARIPGVDEVIDETEVRPS